MTGLIARRRNRFWPIFLVFLPGFLLGAAAMTIYLLASGQASQLTIGQAASGAVIAWVNPNPV